MAFCSLKVHGSRHIVDRTYFHIALWASQFHVWNRYHIMTPVYVSVLYFCIRSLVRHLPNTDEHFNRVFSTCTVRKTKTLGTAWMLIVDWLIFRHGIFQAVKSNRVENASCDITRGILLNIVHAHQIKIRQKKLRNLFTPSTIFFVKKSMFLSSCRKLPAKYFHHIKESEPFSVFVNGTVLQFCIKRTVAMMAQRRVSLNVT